MKHYPIAPPDPVDAIKFRMEQLDMTKADLIQYIGSQSRVSEILNRKRKLTLGMIKSLYKGLKIPAEILLE
jgi:HTH-type transcriptional regulator/antitoxin HigA